MEYMHSYNNDAEMLASDTFTRTRVVSNKLKSTKTHEENELDVLRPKTNYIDAENDFSADEETYVEIRINTGDTLGAIALKYGCRISQLKQLNNFISDQDFYALNVIKLPTTKYGYLKELVKEHGVDVQKPSFCRDHNQVCMSSENRSNEIEGENDRSISPVKEAEQFLQKIDKDILKIFNSTKDHLDTLEDITSSLNCDDQFNVENNDKILSSNKFRIKWMSSIITMIIIGLILLSFYYLRHMF